MGGSRIRYAVEGKLMPVVLRSTNVKRHPFTLYQLLITHWEIAASEECWAYTQKKQNMTVASEVARLAGVRLKWLRATAVKCPQHSHIYDHFSDASNPG